MFSVILYGRNDSHGYNLHKRAAISFNAIAEVMTDPDDEILFVDYNSPDDHSTFPEAISDTLTDKAKKRLRILRVRPTHHAHLKHRTHLVALEPQSRNIALRRSNPRNRWILYTNTDILLVPRDKSKSLTDIVADLPDGFYEAPRFELPEMLWESALDRRDPAGNLALLHEWSAQFHLNQVVRNYLPMRYDGLGDFQLCLREDMFAISGFDEEMLEGWHCDSNLAARLTLYRGSADTLANKLFVYHCGHTRVAASNNKGRQTRMNDQGQYIWNVTSPFLPQQAERWGWPDKDIEEIRIDRELAHQRFSAGVSAAVSPATEPFRATSIESHLYYDLSYDLPHTIPFVCDQVLTYPRSANVTVVGARSEFLVGFAKAWQGMGFSRPISVPRECSSLRMELPEVERQPFRDLLGRTDIFIFEFGLVSQGIDESVRSGRRATQYDKKCLNTVERLFRYAVAIEPLTRPTLRPQQRRFIGVNVIYNDYWPVFTDHISPNISPFCGQVLAGYPRDDKSLAGMLRRLRGRYLSGSFEPSIASNATVN
jgi:hypothetical protein